MYRFALAASRGRVAALATAAAALVSAGRPSTGSDRRRCRGDVVETTSYLLLGTLLYIGSAAHCDDGGSAGGSGDDKYSCQTQQEVGGAPQGKHGGRAQEGKEGPATPSLKAAEGEEEEEEVGSLSGSAAGHTSAGGGGVDRVRLKTDDQGAKAELLPAEEAAARPAGSSSSASIDDKDTASSSSASIDDKDTASSSSASIDDKDTASSSSASIDDKDTASSSTTTTAAAIVTDEHKSTGHLDAARRNSSRSSGRFSARKGEQHVKSDIFYNEMSKFYSFKKRNLAANYTSSGAAAGDDRSARVEPAEAARAADTSSESDVPIKTVSAVKPAEKKESFGIVSFDTIGSILSRYNIMSQFAKKQKKEEESLLKVDSSNVLVAKELLNDAKKYFKSEVNSNEKRREESEREFVNFLYHNIPLKRERGLQMMEKVKRDQFLKQLQIFENERIIKLELEKERKLLREQEDQLEQQRLHDEEEAFNRFDGRDGDTVAPTAETKKTLKDYAGEWERNFRFTARMSLFDFLHTELSKYDKQKVIELYARDIVTVAFNKRQKPENIRVFGKSLQLLFTYEQVLAPTRWLVYWAIQQNHSVWNLLPACYESLDYLADDVNGGGNWTKKQMIDAIECWLNHPVSRDDYIKWLIRQQLQDDTAVHRAVKNYYEKIKKPAANIAINVAVNVTNNKLLLDKIKFDISEYLFYVNNNNSNNNSLRTDRGSYNRSGSSILDVIKGNFSSISDSKIKSVVINELRKANYGNGGRHGDEKKVFASIVSQLVNGRRERARNIKDEFKNQEELHDLIQSHISKIRFSSLFNKTIDSSGVKNGGAASRSENSSFIKIIEKIEK